MRTPVSASIFMAEGDSQTAGFWPLNLEVLLPDWVVRDIAKAGDTTASANAQYSYQAFPYYNSARQNNVYAYRLGTNDLLFSESAADIQTRFQAGCEQARATGFAVMAFTITPATAFSGAQEAIRVAVNDFIRNGDFWDYLIDLANTPEFQDPSDPDYYDGVHTWGPLANPLIAEMVAAELI